MQALAPRPPSSGRPTAPTTQAVCGRNTLQPASVVLPPPLNLVDAEPCCLEQQSCLVGEGVPPSMPGLIGFQAIHAKGSFVAESLGN